MITAIKVRLEPNNKQNTRLFKSAGTSRFVFNWTLSRQQENYKYGGTFISDNDLRKEITQLKHTDQYKWLNEVSNNVAKQAVKDACAAYKKFFKGNGFPKFKSKKKSIPSFYNDCVKLKVAETYVHLEKIGKIKLSESNRIPIGSKYYNPRISFDGLHWYISVGVDIDVESMELTSENVGIDIGLKYLAVCSNGMTFKNVNKSKRVKKLEKKLRRLQRKVSNKYLKNKKGECYIKTSNIMKLEKTIKKVHKRLGNIRTDYRHKVTTEIVKTKPSRIVMESLNVKGMMKNKHLSEAIAKQGFYEFKNMIKYKAEKYSIEFVEADKWYPSSKTCSICGYIKPKLSLSERTFVCECCGAEINRDKNASINLSRYIA